MGTRYPPLSEFGTSRYLDRNRLASIWHASRVDSILNSTSKYERSFDFSSLSPNFSGFFDCRIRKQTSRERRRYVARDIPGLRSRGNPG